MQGCCACSKSTVEGSSTPKSRDRYRRGRSDRRWGAQKRRRPCGGNSPPFGCHSGPRPHLEVLLRSRPLGLISPAAANVLAIQHCIPAQNLLLLFRTAPLRLVLSLAADDTNTFQRVRVTRIAHCVLLVQRSCLIDWAYSLPR